ncbi:hypothetical protein CVD28_10625 [Bacillus sp. M6-12]|uniref:hypothetical protein n=1 Tax=Bacillus sp. M6-12 TaxID=2054166 RepID=UPI000C78D016|nr:hypothetical protein [Bacillus sp. M6-12]PLS17677.1 hypothetical protein CVD28_10625 [Bacillus sp. M6-12]
MDSFDKRMKKDLSIYLHNNVGFTDHERNTIHRKIHKNKTPRFNLVYWTILSFAGLIALMLSFPFIGELTHKSNAIDPEPAIQSNGGEANKELASEVSKIELCIKQVAPIDKENIKYIIEVKNGTRDPIKEGVLYLSHDLKVHDGYTGNPFKVEIKMQKDLPAMETAEYEAIVPSAIFDSTKVNVDNATIELYGFLHNPSPVTVFHTGQSVSLVSKE